MRLEITYLPVENLKPYEKNARKHEVKDVDTIVNSIKEFGFNDPIGIWGKENIVVEGHGRLLAAKKLGMEEVPCVRLDELSDEQRRAYAIAHNKSAELSFWDNDILSLELKDLGESFDMTDFGFGDFELSMLTEDFEPEPYDEEEIEEYEDVGKAVLKKKRILITYKEEDEGLPANLLGLEKLDKVVYDLSELTK